MEEGGLGIEKMTAQEGIFPTFFRPEVLREYCLQLELWGVTMIQTLHLEPTSIALGVVFFPAGVRGCVRLLCTNRSRHCQITLQLQ